MHMPNFFRRFELVKRIGECDQQYPFFSLVLSWRTTMHRRAIPAFEALEQRRLLSGNPFGMLLPMSADILGLQMAIDRSSGAKESSTATTRADGPAAMPSIVGDWTGRVKATALFITKKISFSMHITDQTDTTITGSVSAKGRTYDGTIPITWNGRDFTMSYKDDKISGKLNGTVNEAGDQITGTFKGKGYGLSPKGTFKLDKVA
jgi:hypothetical protein